ncbi:MAG TPA: oxygenase MpaB family protein, partial [Methylomirabilota bacterium]|nr:oxygenase MpaB family protein [Methylomirabilota bacterium]
GYSAHDPALLAWVHATLLDSFLLIYERFVAPLTPKERDCYCLEASAGAALLGIPPAQVPYNAAELAAYMKRMLESGEITVTATARELAREVISPPAPWPARPLLALARLPAVGLLPPPIREAYGFEWTTRQARALSLLERLVRRTLPLVPSPLRYWPAARAAAARERDRLARDSA